MRTLSSALITALLLLPLLPGAAGAQQEAQMRPMYELPTITVSAPSESDPLYDRASALYEQGRWLDAARLHRDAAESMSETDPNAYLQYDRSSRLYFYGGEFGESRKMMERAARIAKATGDMVTAAYRHVDAGFIAVWEGYPGKRREHVAAAEAYAQEYEFGLDDYNHVFALTRGVGLLPVDDKEHED